MEVYRTTYDRCGKCNQKAQLYRCENKEICGNCVLELNSKVEVEE